MGEEIAFEDGRISDFQGLVTLTLTLFYRAPSPRPRGPLGPVPASGRDGHYYYILSVFFIYLSNYHFHGEIKVLKRSK